MKSFVFVILSVLFSRKIDIYIIPIDGAITLVIGKFAITFDQYQKELLLKRSHYQTPSFRYNSVLVRTLRHRLFSAGHRKAQTAQFSLQKIEYLKGCTSKMKDIVILGMLNQMKEGEWWIEDPSGAILIDMKNATFHKGTV